MLRREMAIVVPPQTGRRKRLTRIIATTTVLLVMVVMALILPHTRLLPTSLRQPNPPPFLKARSRDGRWQQDLRYLAHELPRLHVDAFHTLSRSEFQLQVAALRASIPSLSDDEIILRLMALVAALGDGHTTLNYTLLYQAGAQDEDGQGEDGQGADAQGADAQGAERWRLYPISVAWLDGKWYVTGADATQPHLAGAQLVAIDDIPLDGIYARVSAEVAADNEMQRRSGAAPLLVTGEVLHALGITAHADQARFNFILANGQELDTVLHTMAAGALQIQGLELPAQAIPLALENPDRWYWVRALPEQHALYFQYDVCAQMADQPFADFSQELFATLDREQLTRVVVDLRNNSGGDSSVLQPFLAGLAARPGLEVYVLIGRHTFSSALINAIELEQQANAVLVGEPTGGRPNHYGEVRTFMLPNAQLPVTYSTKYFRLLPAADPPALEPEIAAPLTIAGQLAGEDAALAAALSATPPAP